MKKFLALSVATLILLAAITGCKSKETATTVKDNSSCEQAVNSTDKESEDHSSVVASSSEVASDTQTSAVSISAPSKDKWLLSTYKEPLKKGQWGKATLFSMESKQAETVGVTLNKISYGDEAIKILKEWRNKKNCPWTDPKEGFEYAVADISVSFDGFTKDTTGQGIDVDLLEHKLCCTAVDDCIRYKGEDYYCEGENINIDGFCKATATNARILMPIPKDCRQYVLAIGTTRTHGTPVAYFACE